MKKREHLIASWRLLTWCAVAGAMPLTARDAIAESSACASTQQVVFSCQVDSRAVSVCASGKITRTSGTIQYRFGRPARPELIHPRADDDWRALTQGGTLLFSGGGGAYLSFDKPPYRYIVYSAIGKGWGQKSGVVVEKDGRRIVNLPCTGRTTSELGPEFFERAGIRPADHDFELP